LEQATALNNFAFLPGTLRSLGLPAVHWMNGQSAGNSPGGSPKENT